MSLSALHDGFEESKLVSHVRYLIAKRYSDPTVMPCHSCSVRGQDEIAPLPHSNECAVRLELCIRWKTRPELCNVHLVAVRLLPTARVDAPGGTRRIWPAWCVTLGAGSLLVAVRVPSVHRIVTMLFVAFHVDVLWMAHLIANLPLFNFLHVVKFGVASDIESA